MFPKMEVYIFLTGLIVVTLGIPAKDRDPMINEGLFEGDIILGNPNEFKSAIAMDSQRWPDGVVIYAIAPEINEKMKPLIESAMKHIESVTCIRFVERTYQDDYVWISGDSGCTSAVGRKGGKQGLTLGKNCANFGIVLHELIHAIGFQHEHTRSDRDDYVIINWKNIEEGSENSFQKILENTRRFTPFDYFSIMLYGSRSFSKDYYSDKYSMVRKDGSIIDEIHDKKSLSALDALKIDILYECIE